MGIIGELIVYCSKSVLSHLVYNLIVVVALIWCSGCFESGTSSVGEVCCNSFKTFGLVRGSKKKFVIEILCNVKTSGV